ncbi:MAG: C1 family peptidase [Malacoplasma sp.]|nr:C1 family peptidase [Malacoplasma sp.]MDE6429375.1 C1 family peptidase [Malacoplasma sp.]
MKRNIDMELLEKFNNNVCQKNIDKVSNILFNTSIYQASYNALKFNELNHSNFAINLIGLPVENQKKSGRCWLFAATNFMREQIAKKLDLEDFSLSNAYLAFWDKVERSNFFLEAIINNIDLPSDDRLVSHFLSTGIEDGGQWDMAVNLIEKYGIVPYDVMKDTYHAGDTQKINYLLNWKLRDFAATLKKEKDKTYENLSNKKNLMMKEIFKLLQSFYGKIPTNFDFEYSVETKQDSQYVNSYKDLNKKMIVDKNLTPQTFYEKYVDLKLNKFISIIHAPQKSKDFYKLYSFQYLNNVIEGKPIMHCNVELEVFKYLIINQLKNGLPVWFGADVGWFRDWISGNWDDQLFDINNLFNTSFELEKGYQLSYRTSFMTHAMLIVGVNLNLDKLNELDKQKTLNYSTLTSAIKNLEISRWRIQNSWGDDLGDYGYWTISDSWFNKYTYQAVVLKSDLENILKKLELPSLSEQEIVNLDPWDPIGTLA